MFESFISLFVSLLVPLLPPVHGTHTPTCGVPGTIQHPRYVAVFTVAASSKGNFTFQRYVNARTFYATSHSGDGNHVWLDCTR